MNRRPDVDFHPEKPNFEPPKPPPRPGIRLLDSLKMPGGRPLLDPPTLSLDERIETTSNESRPDMNTNRSSARTTIPENLREPIRLPFHFGIDDETTSPLAGTSNFSAFPGPGPLEEDLMDRLDRLAEPDEGFRSEFTLPELPPLPKWNDSTGEATSVSKPTIYDEIETETSPPDSVTVPATETFSLDNRDETSRRTPPIPAIRKPKPTVFRKKLRKPVPNESVDSMNSFALDVPMDPLPDFSSDPAPWSMSVDETSKCSYTRPISRTGQELLVTEELRKSYYKSKLKIPVLKGVNFSVHPGEFVSIVGQSGSGKSTLLHLLGTLDNPESGTIHFDGLRIDNLSIARRDQLRNRSIGFIFQFYHLLPELTTLENVLSPLMVRESVWGYLVRRRGYIEKAGEMLKKVGLSHRLKHKPNELSGGEMQRAAIARALITEPRLLLADEPTGNLDAASAREIIELLQELSEDKNLTIVMVTHDNEIARVAHRSVRMFDGRIIDEA